jgi:hypothetical protein
LSHNAVQELLGPEGVGELLSSKTSRESFLLEVTDEDVAIIPHDGRYALPWGGFRRWCVTQNLLILIRSGDCLVVIPKRDCTVDGWRHLHEMVERRMGPPSRW